jgi:hypothetical protein
MITIISLHNNGEAPLFGVLTMPLIEPSIQDQILMTLAVGPGHVTEVGATSLSVSSAHTVLATALVP